MKCTVLKIFWRDIIILKAYTWP